LNNQNNLIWFSHRGAEYEVKEMGDKKIVEFTNRVKTFDWDNCTIQIAHSPIKRLRIFIRGHENKFSDYNKKVVKPTFLLAIDIDTIVMPTEQSYQIGSERKELETLHSKTFSRYVFQLDNDYWIWEWKKNYSDIKQSVVYGIYEQITTFLSNPPKQQLESGSIIAVSPVLHDDKDPLPVVYQPAIDELKNFVREIHCCETQDDRGKYIEVSIMFNNEELRRHKSINALYEKFRLWFYGRNIDIETFRIYLPTAQYNHNYFTFERIYSGDYGIVEDTIHGDDIPPTPKRDISYYFMDQFHPVIFINTSNHAMAEKDNNSTLWKWEYQPFEEKSPVVFGTKSRKEIDNQFTSLYNRFMRWARI
jgi:hypothetical protein